MLASWIHTLTPGSAKHLPPIWLAPPEAPHAHLCISACARGFEPRPCGSLPFQHRRRCLILRPWIFMRSAPPPPPPPPPPLLPPLHRLRAKQPQHRPWQTVLHTHWAEYPSVYSSVHPTATRWQKAEERRGKGSEDEPQKKRRRK